MNIEVDNLLKTLQSNFRSYPDYSQPTLKEWQQWHSNDKGWEHGALEHILYWSLYFYLTLRKGKTKTDSHSDASKVILTYKDKPKEELLDAVIKQLFQSISP